MWCLGLGAPALGEHTDDEAQRTIRWTGRGSAMAA